MALTARRPGTGLAAHQRMRIKELAHGFPCNSACSPTSPWHDCHRCFLALWGRDGAHCRNESGKAPTALDRVWVLNPHAYDELAPLGKPVAHGSAHVRWD